MISSILYIWLIAGSGYKIGNRRLHIYFFSTQTWKRQTAPVEALDKFKETLNALKSATDEGERVKLEVVLINSLQVYDFEDNENDAFEKGRQLLFENKQ